MDDFLIYCMFGLLLLIVFGISAFMRRNRPAPHGTYDDPDVRSSGSIGGRPGQRGQRAHDDPDIRSGGSIGGTHGQAGARTHDDPNVRSGGSIGGSSAGPARSEEPREARRERRNDDPDVRSGGSFGG